MAISKQQRAALRYLTSAIEGVDPVTKKRVMMRPSIRATAKRYHIKEETLLKWLGEDEEFQKIFIDSIKADVLNEIRSMIRAVIDNVKETGNATNLKFLLQWVGQYGIDADKEQSGWEATIMGKSSKSKTRGG